MMPLADRLATPLPRRMERLKRDARGYPIPFIVLRDANGMPQFTINDQRKVTQCRLERRCSICAGRFDRDKYDRAEMWFVGGSRCFLHQHGAFLDPPLHLDCAEYALRVCPFLAARSYSKRIDDAKLPADGLPAGMALTREEFMMPRLPERFGLGRTSKYRTIVRPRDVPLFSVESWDYVEFWQAGEPVNAPMTADPPPDAEVAA